MARGGAAPGRERRRVEDVGRHLETVVVVTRYTSAQCASRDKERRHGWEDETLTRLKCLVGGAEIAGSCRTAHFQHCREAI